MAIVNVKEIYKEFNLTKKHFKKAVDLAKKNIVVGKVSFDLADYGKFPSSKKPRARKAKFTGEPEGKELPDLDKSGYMSKRKKEENAVQP